MKIGIGQKLFLAIFATCMLVVLTMHLAIRFSFEQGFIGYLQRSAEDRTEMVADVVAEQYADYGNWYFLRNNQRGFMQALRALDADRHMQHMERGWRMRFWLLDTDNKRLFGHGPVPPGELYRKPVKYEENIVGWVVMPADDKINLAADQSFAHQQARTSWIVSALVLLVTVIVTWLLARGFLRPVKRLAESTHQLAAGNFSSRVPVHGNDEIARLADDFNQLASTLEKNELMRRDYMADVSHELRTPLAVLQGELEALQDGIRQSTPETLASLLAEVQTLTKLVSDLHQLSLSDRGSLSYRKEPCNLSDVISRSLGVFRHRLQEKNLRVSVSLPETLMVFGDDARLGQLFHNLLENSLRYTDSGGEITVTAQQDDKQIRVDWSDSAPGLNDEQFAHIFERFYRSESSRNRASGGSGLGLAICDKITEAHHGQISASASPLGGVTITLVLPRSDTRE